MPSAYVFVEVDIHDRDTFAAYTEGAAATVTAHGGSWFLDGASRREVVEGDPNLGYFVSAKFPDYESAMGWYRSPDYAPFREMRKNAVTIKRMLIVDGLA